MRALLYLSLAISTLLATIFLTDEFLSRRARFEIPSIIALSAFLGWAAFSLVSVLLHRSGRKEIVVRIWVPLVTAALAYAVLDLVAGQLLIPRLSPPMKDDVRVHHRLVPDTQSEFRTREYHYLQSVNSLEIRGPEIEALKPAGVTRVLMLGDSFTMGKGVPDDETFSARLERRLNGPDPPDGTFQVLNAGVDSYAPVLSLIQLKRKAKVLDPDVVILNLDNSDLLQDAAYRKLAVVGPLGDVVSVSGVRNRRPSTMEAFRRWIDQNLYFTRLVLFHVGQWTESRELTVRNTAGTANPEILRHTLANDPVDRTEQWAALFGGIVAMKEFCDARGIDFRLTIYPWGHQVSDGEWARGRNAFLEAGDEPSDASRITIRELADRHGVFLIDTYDAFREAAGPLYFDYDMHWNAAGHEVMAAEIHRALIEEIASAPTR